MDDDRARRGCCGRDLVWRKEATMIGFDTAPQPAPKFGMIAMINHPSDITPGMKPPFAWLTDDEWAHTDMPNRATLWAAYFCDVLQIREEPKDSNRGEWVEWMLRLAGVNAPNPWCASFQNACEWAAGNARHIVGAAAVISWSRSKWYKKVSTPKKGDLAYWLNPDGHGHIMRVTGSSLLYIETIEGNAQPGNEGDQREGGGCYRRKRLKSWKIKYLRAV